MKTHLATAVKALTLWQPWATLIADGRKRYETRSWPPPRRLIGRRIAIHAGTHRDRETGALARRWGLCDLPLGAVVCTCRLVAAHHISHHSPDGTRAMVGSGYIGGPASIPIDEYGDYAPGRWAWELDQVIPHDPPVAARGRQGLWEWGTL